MLHSFPSLFLIIMIWRICRSLIRLGAGWPDPRTSSTGIGINKAGPADPAPIWQVILTNRQKGGAPTPYMVTLPHFERGRQILQESAHLCQPPVCPSTHIFSVVSFFSTTGPGSGWVEPTNAIQSQNQVQPQPIHGLIPPKNPCCHSGCHFVKDMPVRCNDILTAQGLRPTFMQLLKACSSPVGNISK